MTRCVTRVPVIGADGLDLVLNFKDREDDHGEEVEGTEEDRQEGGTEKGGGVAQEEKSSEKVGEKSGQANGEESGEKSRAQGAGKEAREPGAGEEAREPGSGSRPDADAGGRAVTGAVLAALRRQRVRRRRRLAFRRLQASVCLAPIGAKQ